MYRTDVPYQNNLEILDLVMYLFSKTVLKNELTLKQRDILREYLLNGYNAATKRGILLNLNMNSKNLNQQNCNLQKMGFLHPDKYSQKNKVIDSDLIALRDYFLNEDTKKLFLVNFVKK